jgi:hypothetical protein
MTQRPFDFGEVTVRQRAAEQWRVYRVQLPHEKACYWMTHNFILMWTLSHSAERKWPLLFSLSHPPPHTHTNTHQWPTTWSWVLEKMIVAQLVKKFRAFYGTQRFITVFTTTRHWSIFWAKWITL